MKNIWSTKEWKEAKEKAIKEGKLKDECEKCKRKERLTPHHKVSFSQLYFNEQQRSLKILFTELKEKGEIAKGYVPKQIERKLIFENDIKKKSYDLALKEYLEFNDIQTLCRRCHFMEEKGLILCEYCNKKNHHYMYDSCFNCKDKAEEEVNKAFKEIEEEENKMEKEIWKKHYESKKNRT